METLRFPYKFLEPVDVLFTKFSTAENSSLPFP